MVFGEFLAVACGVAMLADRLRVLVAASVAAAPSAGLTAFFTLTTVPSAFLTFTILYSTAGAGAAAAAAVGTVAGGVIGISVTVTVVVVTVSAESCVEEELSRDF